MNKLTTFQQTLGNKADTSNSRNPSIELLRGWFCLMILLHHSWTNFASRQNFPFYIYQEGGQIAVDFFFIVSGAFMAARIAKMNRNEPSPSWDSLGREAVGFTVKKYKGLAPYLFFTLPVVFVLYMLLDKWSLTKTLTRAVYSLPQYFLIDLFFPTPWQMTGQTWYLSVMLLSMFILYPLGRKTGEKLNCVIAPILTMVCFSVIYASSCTLVRNTKAISGVLTVDMLRGMGDISLGCLCYSVSEKIRQWNMTKKTAALLTILEISAYVVVSLYACTNYTQMSFIMVLAAWAAVAVTLSGKSVVTKHLNHPIVYTIGRMTLPVYLAQKIPLLIIKRTALPLTVKYLLFISATIVLAFIIETGVTAIKKKKLCRQKA